MVNKNSSKYKVLLVDDEVNQLDNIEKIINKSESLKEHVCIERELVDSTRGAEDIANKIKKEPTKWDIILSDLFMPTPEKGGILIANALVPHYTNDSNFPVILLFISKEEGAGKYLREYIPRFKRIDWYPKPGITRKEKRLEYLAPRPLFTRAIAEAVARLNNDANNDKKSIIDLNDIEIGLSAEMKMAKSLADIYARNDGNVLILGKTGTGKEVLAKYIHNKRKEMKKRNEEKCGNFEAINCASTPESIVESELFGTIKKYPGFQNEIRLKGAFEKATHGTILLDEIGKVSKKILYKLLRILDPNIKEYKPLGESAIKFEGKIICATSEPLDEMVDKGGFSQDVYRRISGELIKLPPLCKRKEDILPLAIALKNKIVKDGEGKYLNKEFSEEAKTLLTEYTWPRNIGELEEAIRNALYISDTRKLIPEDFYLIEQQLDLDLKKLTNLALMKNLSLMPPDTLVIKTQRIHVSTILKHAKNFTEEGLRNKILEGYKMLYKESNDNVTELTKIMGCSRKYYYQKLNKWGLTPDDIKK